MIVLGAVMPAAFKPQLILRYCYQFQNLAEKFSVTTQVFNICILHVA